MSKTSAPILSRRSLFAGAGTAGALAAVAAVLPATSRQAETAGSAPRDAAHEAQGRYQLTQHVLHYYRTAKV